MKNKYAPCKGLDFFLFMLSIVPNNKRHENTSKSGYILKQKATYTINVVILNNALFSWNMYNLKIN